MLFNHDIKKRTIGGKMIHYVKNQMACPICGTISLQLHAVWTDCQTDYIEIGKAKKHVYKCSGCSRMFKIVLDRPFDKLELES
jgi:ribosomal protein L34E